MEHLFELDMHESTQLTANPYWLWIRVYFPDQEFAAYLDDVCETKNVVIYQFSDEFKAKLMLPSTYILLDRMDGILKSFKQNFNPNNMIQYNVNADIQLSFDSEKARLRFSKQFIRQLECFIKKEQKIYSKIRNDKNYIGTNTNSSNDSLNFSKFLK